ncbi:MAG: TlpA family protein disulfide reductase [Deltaproteobacteria bacterium]|nr:TlpA family protein disulfide reductase [Deltaproteobacteria bacterium]
MTSIAAVIARSVSVSVSVSVSSVPVSLSALALALALPLGLSSVSCAGAGRSNVQAEISPEILPRFVFRDFSGRSLSNQDYLGSVLLLDIWASWCAPCEASLPFYASLFERFSARGLRVLAVSVDEHEDDVRAFLARHPMPFDVVRGDDHAFLEQLGVDTMPSLWIVGRDGRIISRHAGFEARDRVDLERLVLRALDLSAMTSNAADVGTVESSKELSKE